MRCAIREGNKLWAVRHIEVQPATVDAPTDSGDDGEGAEGEGAEQEGALSNVFEGKSIARD